MPSAPQTQLPLKVYFFFILWACASVCTGTDARWHRILCSWGYKQLQVLETKVWSSKSSKLRHLFRSPYALIKLFL